MISRIRDSILAARDMSGSGTATELVTALGVDLKPKEIVGGNSSSYFAEIDNMGHKTLLGKVELSQQEAKGLKQLAKKGVAADNTSGDLQRDLKSARRDAQIWKRRYKELMEQTKDFLTALKKVRGFISKVLHGLLLKRKSKSIRAFEQ